MVKNILFICKFNRFRSRVAEAYLKKINPTARVKSAGIIKGNLLNQNQVNIASEFGIDIKGKPKGLTSKLLKWQNILIIVADDVPKEIFNNERYGKNTFLWNIPDTSSDNNEEIRKIVKAIMVEVDKLNEELK